jgi:dCMP deaminase
MRPDWDEWALGVAEAVALRGECTHRRVGCVILDEWHRVVSAGYNGAPAGVHPSCLEGGCPRGRLKAGSGTRFDVPEGECIAVHAEQNALLYADPGRLRGAALYCTDEPCHVCSRLIRGTGIIRVVSKPSPYTTERRLRTSNAGSIL